MSIRKRERKKGTTYQVRVYDEAGRPRSKSFTRKADAEVYEHTWQLSKRRGDLGKLDAGLVTFAEFVVRWETEYSAVHLMPKTRSQNAAILANRLLPEFGTRPLRRISTATITAFQAQLVKEGVGDATIRKTISVLQGILRFAVEVGELDANPAASVRKAPAKRERTPKALSPDQIEHVRQALPTPRDRALVAILAYAGLRPGEARALIWGDIGDRSISVSRRAIEDGSIVDGTKAPRRSAPRSRTVPLLVPLAQDLREFRMASGRPPDETLIFAKADGIAWTGSDWKNWERRTFRQAVKQSGLEGVIPYDLRHSYGSLMHAARRNVIEIARSMGHGAHVNLTTYSHEIAEFDDRDAIEPEQEIWAARSRMAKTWPDAASGTVVNDRKPALSRKPSNGLEPLTPSLPWRCSTN